MRKIIVLEFVSLDGVMQALGGPEEDISGGFKYGGWTDPYLQVYGSGNFVQTLLKNDLVDEFWLKIFPITLGSGKRLFGEGTSPAAFELTDSKVSPSCVIFANYIRAGEVKTGSFGD